MVRKMYEQEGKGRREWVNKTCLLLFLPMLLLDLCLKITCRDEVVSPVMFKLCACLLLVYLYQVILVHPGEEYRGVRLLLS